MDSYIELILIYGCGFIGKLTVLALSQSPEKFSRQIVQKKLQAIEMWFLYKFRSDIGAGLNSFLGKDYGALIA